MTQVESMHQFNYHSGKVGLAIDEDVEILEREIESVLMRKGVETAASGTR